MGSCSSAPDSGWRTAHDQRRQLQRRLIVGGYRQRHLWEREQLGTLRIGRHDVPYQVYVEGPHQGYSAVDAWRLARALGSCGASWGTQLRHAPAQALTVAPGGPQGCGQSKICPVCAHVQSLRAARDLRTVLAHDYPDRELALVTITQRARVGESLDEALDRMRRSTQRATQGRPGRRWREAVEGWVWTYETVRAWPGAHDGAPCPPIHARHWHVHVHAVLVLAEGGTHASAAQVVGPILQAATGYAALEAGLPGYGWDPYAGGAAVDMDGTVREWMPGLSACDAGASSPHITGWYQPISTEGEDALAGVYQACKYASPLVDKAGPIAVMDLLEFCSVMNGTGRGRRMSAIGKGALHGYHARAETIRAELGHDPGNDSPAERAQSMQQLMDRIAADADMDAPQLLPEPELPPVLSHDGPTLDQVAPDMGWRDAQGRACERPRAHRRHAHRMMEAEGRASELSQTVRWRVAPMPDHAPDVAPPELRQLEIDLAAIGGWLYCLGESDDGRSGWEHPGWYASVPRAWAEAHLVRVEGQWREWRAARRTARLWLESMRAPES